MRNVKLLEKYKTIWTKNKDLKIIELNALPVSDNWYIRTKIGTYGDKASINFRDLTMPKDVVECECFWVISINYLCCIMIELV